MVTKYYLLTKDGKKVDDVLRTKDELRDKVNEIMQKENCDWKAIDENYTYKEVADGGVSTEENAVANTETANTNTSENNNAQYDFGVANDINKPTLGDDEEGWNKTLENLDHVSGETAGLVKSYKKYLELTEKNKTSWAVRKNAIRVLYMFNEFLRFYAAYGEDESIPVELRSYLKEKRTFLSATRNIDGLDGIKEDMADIVEDMLESLKKYMDADDVRHSRVDFYDEIKEFDEELENLDGLFGLLAMSNRRVGTADYKMVKRCAEEMAESDEDFKKFCGDNPPDNAMLSKYLKETAVKKYHLGRIKMDSNDENSTLGGVSDWVDPSGKESKNVRLSDNIEDYLNLKPARILNEEDQKKVEEIKKEFLSGKKDQKTAQVEINKLVYHARETIRKSMKTFFDFMGITDKNVMNQFMSGLKRLDETEYKNNWSRLVENYKDTMAKNIAMYKKAHSNDMTAEDIDSCVKELEKLLSTADDMLSAVNSGDGNKLLADSTAISTVIGDVQKRTAEAKKAFKGA